MDNLYGGFCVDIRYGTYTSVSHGIMHIDNLYLDVSRVVGYFADKLVNIDYSPSEDETLNEVMRIIDDILNFVQPKKLVYFALNGALPMAEVQLLRDKYFWNTRNANVDGAKKRNRYDYSCKAPGIRFMAKLQARLEYFIVNNISTSWLWKKCKVIFSGYEVPGESKSKFMEYIRYSKTQPDYDPDTRHCLFGTDYVLTLLGLCSRERNICVLHPAVHYYKDQELRMVDNGSLGFVITNISIIRDHLAAEFEELKETLPFSYNLENIIDDWVLLNLLFGSEICPRIVGLCAESLQELEVLTNGYKVVAPTLDGYLNEGGHLNLSRFRKFVLQLAEIEEPKFKLIYERVQKEKLEKRKKKEKMKETEEANEAEANSEKEDEVGNVESIDSDVEEMIKNLYECPMSPSIEASDIGKNSDVKEESDEEALDFEEAFLVNREKFYRKNLNRSEITDEVLSSLAEDYLRALHWLLQYYYHGCISWSWYYPHRFSPYFRDLTYFKGANLDFEMGQPLLPHEAILALTTPQSKDELPEAYQKLITSPDSPIKDYYPEEMKIGVATGDHPKHQKQISLIPMIDINKLLNAVASVNDELTPEEKLLNKHGQARIYSYTSEDQGLYKAPECCPRRPDVLSNHASMRTASEGEWAVDASSANIFPQRKEGSDDVAFLNFPTFRYLPHKVLTDRVEYHAKSKSVGTFFREVLMMTIILEETPDIDKLASEWIGKILYGTLPSYEEIRVVGLIDSSHKWIRDSGGSSEIVKVPVTNKDKEIFEDDSSDCESENYKVKVYVMANHLRGMKLNFDSDAVASYVKAWSDKISYYPLELVKDLNMYERDVKLQVPAEDVFPIGSEVFMLGHPCYGCKGRVTAIKGKQKNLLVQVEFEVPEEEHGIGRELNDRFTGVYYSASVVAERIGIHKAVVGMIAGSVLMYLSKPDEEGKKKVHVNVGLRLRNNKRNIEVPGFTKRHGSCWMYSNKAVNAMMEYADKCPQLVKYLSGPPKKDFIIDREDIFPGPDGEKEAKNLVKWISELECSKAERVHCHSQFVSKEVIEEMKKIVDESPKKFSTKTMWVRPALLFKRDLVIGRVDPVESADYQLFDRIVSVAGPLVTPGTRGYIVGIRKEYTAMGSVYEILSDEPLIEGKLLHSVNPRKYKTSRFYFINISHGERAFQSAKQVAHSQASEMAEFQRCSDSSMPATLNKEARPSSAFAQWNNYPCAPSACDDTAEQFKSLWSYLEKAKSQDETKILKQILKIDEEEKPKIEDNVKTFFENISRNSEGMALKSGDGTGNLNSVLNKSQRETDDRHRLQLFHYFLSRNLGQPRFRFMKLNDNVVSQVVLPDGRTFKGFPCADEESASDSAAFQALGALGEVQSSDDSSVQKEYERVRKIMKNQRKCERSSGKEEGGEHPPADADSNNATVDGTKSAMNAKSKACSSDKVIRNGKLQQQQQQQPQPQQQQQSHRRNVPQILPTPPLQWRKQSKASSNPSYAEQSKAIANANHGEDQRARSELAGRKEKAANQGARIGEFREHRNRSDSCGNYRSPDWRNDEKVVRGQQQQQQQQNEPRTAKEFLRYNNSGNNNNNNNNNNKNNNYNSDNNSNRRQRSNQCESGQGISLRPDIYYVKQGHGSANSKSAAAENSQGGSNGNCQRLSAVATEFIPLQALTRNRGRGNNVVVTPKKNKEAPQTIPSKSSGKVVASPREDKSSSSTKQQRKSKIAAKFDAEWDPQG